MGGRLAIALALVVAACGTSNGDGGSQTQDAAPESEVASSGCHPGEMLADDGHCEPAGIPPSMCGKGFESDGNRGCNAILPSDPCPPGKMAVPGETTCRDVAPCGSGTWGDIPVESNTQFVDASFSGTSDGSMKAPWRKVTDGISAAASGAIVAVAAGSYAEDLHVGNDFGFGGKPVRLWGKCPAMVEIVGSAAAIAAVFVSKGAAGSEIRDLAIRGDAVGILVLGSKAIVVDRVWIHDTAGRGIEINDTRGDGSLELTGSLVEHAHDVGVLIRGFTRGPGASIEATLVRDTQPRPDGTFGRGVSVASTGQPSNVVVRGVVVERNREVGMDFAVANGTVEASVVRDTQTRESDQTMGHGIHAYRANVTVRASVLERNHEIGLAVVGSDVTIETTVVRDTRTRTATSDHEFGIGIDVSDDPVAGGNRSSAHLRASVIEESYDIGLLVSASDATAEGIVVRTTRADQTYDFLGDGITVFALYGPASIVVTASRIEQSVRAGLASFGADVKLGSTTLECNAFHLDGESTGGVDSTFEDLGGNACGCGGASVQCHASSNGLAPPVALKP